MEFMGKQKTVMICSVDEDGYPNAKAMFSPRKIENDYFYFSSNVSAKRTAQYLQNPYACIYAYQKGRFRYEGWMLIDYTINKESMIRIIAFIVSKPSEEDDISI